MVNMMGFFFFIIVTFFSFYDRKINTVDCVTLLSDTYKFLEGEKTDWVI